MRANLTQALAQKQEKKLGEGARSEGRETRGRVAKNWGLTLTC